MLVSFEARCKSLLLSPPPECRQSPSLDGVGDRITSLTLRCSCWLLMRETKHLDNFFCVRLNPGDVYTMAAESRWRWQHAILLDEPPKDANSCRISLLWRVLEEYPC
eukprot:m.235561 g.235561  ORF g.235561 m.235561 type:complete len:107 (-) comp22482_c1_seq2:79-399(-)